MMGSALAAYGYGLELPRPAVRELPQNTSLIGAVTVEGGMLGIRESRYNGKRIFLIELQREGVARRYMRVFYAARRGKPDVLGLGTDSIAAASHFLQVETAAQSMDALIAAGEFVLAESFKLAAVAL